MRKTRTTKCDASGRSDCSAWRDALLYILIPWLPSYILIFHCFTCTLDHQSSDNADIVTDASSVTGLLEGSDGRKVLYRVVDGVGYLELEVAQRSSVIGQAEIGTKGRKEVVTKVVGMHVLGVL